MSNVRCLQIFLHAVKRDEPELTRALGSESFDPDEFYAFARRHAVAGYFYALLKDEGFRRLLPGGLDARLRDVREIQAAKADRLPEIRRLRQRFERAGLDVIFIKGPFLSKRFYGDPGFRYYGDIDLLVHGRGDVTRSAGVLREAGYVRRSIPLLGHGAARTSSSDGDTREC